MIYSSECYLSIGFCGEEESSFETADVKVFRRRCVFVHASLSRKNVLFLQELYALGLTECLCSFFSVYPASTAMARSVVFEQAGARSQVSNGARARMLMSRFSVIHIYLYDTSCFSWLRYFRAPCCCRCCSGSVPFSTPFRW